MQITSKFNSNERVNAGSFRRIASAYRDKVVETDYFLSHGHFPIMLQYRGIETNIVVEQAPYLFITNHTYANSLKKAPANPWTSHHRPDDNDFKYIPMRDWKTLKLINRRVETIPTFREFVLYAVSLVMRCRDDYRCLGRLDEHIAPMVTTCNPCLHSFDVIVKVSILTHVSVTLTCRDLC